MVYVCAYAEKETAVQELQQRLTELTAGHEAAIEAMRVAHRDEIESLKKEISSCHVLQHAAASMPENDAELDTVPGASDGSVVDASSVRGVVSGEDEAFVANSRLSVVEEFIAYIQHLGPSQDGSAYGEDESTGIAENSHAKLLSAARAFALRCRLSASDSPLQVENVQRLEQVRVPRKQFSSTTDEVGDLVFSAEPSQPTSSYPEISSDSVSRDDGLGNAAEAGVSADVDISTDEFQNDVHSTAFADDAGRSSDEVEQNMEDAERAVILAKMAPDQDVPKEQFSSDDRIRQLENQLHVSRQKLESEAVTLREAVEELSQYKEKNTNSEIEASSLRKDIERLEAANVELSDKIAQMSAFEKRNCDLQLELDEVKERTVQLEEHASRLRAERNGLKERVDLLEKEAGERTAELETKIQAVTALDDKVVVLSLELQSRSNELEERSAEFAAAYESLEMSRNEMKTEIKWAITQRNDLTNELQRLKENVTALETERDDLMNQVGQKSAEFEGVLATRDSEYRTKCDALVEELRISRERAVQLANELQHSADSSKSLEASAEAAGVEVADLKQQLVLLRSELNSFRRESEQASQLLEKERDLCKSELAEKGSELEKSEEEVCRLTEIVERLNVDVAEKDKSGKETEMALRHVTEQCDAQLVELRSLRTNCEQAQLEEDGHLNSVSELEEKLHEKTHELTLVREEYEVKITQLSSKVDDLIGQLESDRRSREAEVDKVTASHAVELEAKESEMAILKSAIDDLQEMHDELALAVQSKEEAIASVEGRHSLELAAMAEKCEAKVSDLEREHHLVVEELRQKVAEMEQSDVELSTQLIAVTEKFNSVTEFAASAKRTIEEYRSKAEGWTAERQEMMTAGEVLSAKLVEREEEIGALREQMRMLKAAADAQDVAAATAEDGSMEASYDGSQQIGNSSRENSESVSLPGPDKETCGAGASARNGDLLTLGLENLDPPLQPEHQHFADLSSQKEKYEQLIEQMKMDHRAAMQDLEDQHNGKVIQLIKDFNTQIATNEKEIKETMNCDVG